MPNFILPSLLACLAVVFAPSGSLLFAPPVGFEGASVSIQKGIYQIESQSDVHQYQELYNGARSDFSPPQGSFASVSAKSSLCERTKSLDCYTKNFHLPCQRNEKNSIISTEFNP